MIILLSFTALGTSGMFSHEPDLCKNRNGNLWWQCQSPSWMTNVKSLCFYQPAWWWVSPWTPERFRFLVICETLIPRCLLQIGEWGSVTTEIMTHRTRNMPSLYHQTVLSQVALHYLLQGAGQNRQNLRGSLRDEISNSVPPKNPPVLRKAHRSRRTRHSCNLENSGIFLR